MKKNIILGIIASAILSANAQFVVPSATATTLHTYTGGKVGIGNTAALTTPTAQLQLSSTTDNRQIVLNGAAAGISNQFQMAGFGYNNSILKYQLPSTASDHAFYAATSTTAANELMRIRGNGNVGIGIANPSVKLSLGATSVNTKLAIYENGTSLYGFGYAANQFRFHLGAQATDRFSFLDAPSGNELFKINANGSVISNINSEFDGFTVQSSKISPYFSLVGLNTPAPNGVVNQTLSIGLGTGIQQINGSPCNGCYSSEALPNDAVIRIIGASPSHLILQNSNAGSIKFAGVRNNAERQSMEIMSDGRVIIGNYTQSDANDFVPGTNSATFPSATQYKLIVATGILTPKVKCAVATTSDWSDYVFADNYKLKTLDSVANYIKINKHLPDVPSAQDMVNHGLDVAKTDAILLQKIEELTLYMIELKKQNEKLAAEVASLKK